MYTVNLGALESPVAASRADCARRLPVAVSQPYRPVKRLRVGESGVAVEDEVVFEGRRRARGEAELDDEVECEHEVDAAGDEEGEGEEGLHLHGEHGNQ